MEELVVRVDGIPQVCVVVGCWKVGHCMLGFWRIFTSDEVQERLVKGSYVVLMEGKSGGMHLEFSSYISEDWVFGFARELSREGECLCCNGRRELEGLV